jgi:hypothetical protein
MPEVLEIEQTKVEVKDTIESPFSWKVEMPESVIKENNLSENAYLVLTVYNGKINGERINPTVAIKHEVKRITEKYRKTFEEMKNLGD